MKNDMKNDMRNEQTNKKIFFYIHIPLTVLVLGLW